MITLHVEPMTDVLYWLDVRKVMNPKADAYCDLGQLWKQFDSIWPASLKKTEI